MGHIFGVESPLMVEKLEQYNRVIEVSILSCCSTLQRFALANVVAGSILSWVGFSLYA